MALAVNASGITVTTMSSGGVTPAMMADNVIGTGIVKVANSEFARILVKRPIPDPPYFIFESVNCSPYAVGAFTNGITAVGTPLPQINQPVPAPPIPIKYSGGIGIDSGIVLGTGWISDFQYPPSYPAPAIGQGYGVEGPNNGDSGGCNADAGIVSASLYNDGEQRNPDDDFFSIFGDLSGEGSPGDDATALEFKVRVGYSESTPTYPGFFKVTLVMATDEDPFYLAQNNWYDSVAVIVRHSTNTHIQPPNQNIFTFRKVVSTNPFVVQNFPLNMKELFQNCRRDLAMQDKGYLLQTNQIAPNPSDLQCSETSNQVMGTPYYDHEYGGFTVPLTRQSGDRGPDPPEPLPPGEYTVKIVIQDVRDQIVDAAVFVKSHGLKFQQVLPADFNLDGTVDGGDFIIWNSNKFESGKKFAQGDANFDGVVDGNDFIIWNTWKFVSGGFKHLLADFNDDGLVNQADYAVWQQFKGLTSCASRFEGDADGDGDVDCTDCQIWASHAQPPGSCPGCSN